MTLRTRTILVVSITAVIAAAGGYIAAGVTYGQLGALWASSSYLNAASNAKLDVKVLDALRKNNLPSALAILEARLDGELLHLSTYHEAIPFRMRDVVVYDAIADARVYRAMYPSSLRDGNANDAIKKALSLMPIQIAPK